jgi:hypothetical protein
VSNSALRFAKSANNTCVVFVVPHVAKARQQSKAGFKFLPNSEYMPSNTLKLPKTGQRTEDTINMPYKLQDAFPAGNDLYKLRRQIELGALE